MSDTSEEKNLPASDKKLRDARTRGQVAKSQDIVSGTVMITSFGYLIYSASDVRTKIEELLLVIGRHAYADPYSDVLTRATAIAERILVSTAAPLLLLVVACVVLTNVAVMRGFVFSSTPIKPNLQHINPISGAKRIFSLRGVVEFVKALLKLLLLATAFVFAFRSQLPTLLQSSSCVSPCTLIAFNALFQVLVITAIAAFIAIGIIDILLQRWLFTRDQRMTKSEAKRERRDAEGDPAILQQRQKQRRETHAFATKTGLLNASFCVGAPNEWTVGIRYVRGETPVPIVVYSVDGQSSTEAVAQALSADIPVVRDIELAHMIGRSTRSGSPVPEDMFQRVADILVALRLI